MGVGVVLGEGEGEVWGGMTWGGGDQRVRDENEGRWEIFSSTEYWSGGIDIFFYVSRRQLSSWNLQYVNQEIGLLG